MRSQELVWKSESLRLINSRCPPSRVGDAWIILSWVFVIQMYSTHWDTCSATWVLRDFPECFPTPTPTPSAPLGHFLPSEGNRRLGRNFLRTPKHTYTFAQTVPSPISILRSRTPSTGQYPWIHSDYKIDFTRFSLLLPNTPPRSPQLPLASALPSSSAQVSVVQAAAAVELHRQDEESAQLSSISVRHMTATAPPPAPPPTNTHARTPTHTHTHTQAKGKYKEWGCAALLIVQRHRNCLSLCLSLSLSLSLLPPSFSMPFSAHYPPHLHAGCQRAGNDGEGNKIKGLEQW